MQGLRKSITFHWLDSSMFHLSMLLRSRAKESTREIDYRKVDEELRHETLLQIHNQLR